jgi:hypothetical protein
VRGLGLYFVNDVLITTLQQIGQKIHSLEAVPHSFLHHAITITIVTLHVFWLFITNA